MSDNEVSPRARMALRLVQAGTLIGLLWKWQFFVYAYQLYQTIPLNDPFFPPLFRSPLVLAAAYLGAAGGLALGLITGRRVLLILLQGIALIGVTITCLHQGSYNDATFTTSWWASVWMLWFATRLELDPEQTLLRKAALLSRLIVSVILLGGAVGKWTPEYWSGEVLHNIYFVDRPHWTFQWLRDGFSPETVRSIATLYSRFVIFTETVCGMGLWLAPTKIAAVLGIVVLSGIAIFSNWFLFSVLASLIALAATGLFCRKS